MDKIKIVDVIFKFCLIILLTLMVISVNELKMNGRYQLSNGGDGNNILDTRTGVLYSNMFKNVQLDSTDYELKQMSRPILSK